MMRHEDVPIRIKPSTSQVEGAAESGKRFLKLRAGADYMAVLLIQGILS